MSLSANEYFDKVKEKYKDKFEYDESSFISLKSKITFLCKKHNKTCHPQAGNHLYLGTIGCPACKKEASQKARSLTTEEFIHRAKKVHGNTYDYTNSIFTGYQKKVEITCKVHGSFWQNANDHLSRKPGHGCPLCYNENRGDSRRMPFSDFVSRSQQIHNNKYTYPTPKTWKNLKNLKIKIICPLHGEFIQRVSDHLYLACGCPTCCESQGEKAVETFLIKSNFEYEREKTFDWLINPKTKKQLPLDFYIEQFKLAIEIDGERHRHPVEYFGGVEAFESTKNKDLLRENLCKSHGITLIRVYYSDKREIDKTMNSLQNSLNLFDKEKDL